MSCRVGHAQRPQSPPLKPVPSLLNLGCDSCGGGGKKQKTGTRVTDPNAAVAFYAEHVLFPPTPDDDDSDSVSDSGSDSGSGGGGVCTSVHVTLWHSCGASWAKTLRQVLIDFEHFSEIEDDAPCIVFRDAAHPYPADEDGGRTAHSLVRVLACASTEDWKKQRDEALERLRNRIDELFPQATVSHSVDSDSGLLEYKGNKAPPDAPPGWKYCKYQEDLWQFDDEE